MPMNIDGNFVTRFGDRLPVPYMEKITVRDASFEIQLSFYIKPPNLNEIDSGFYSDYLDSLNNLKVSIVTVADGVKESSIDAESGYSVETNPEDFYRKYGPISIGPAGTMLFEHLTTNDINVLQIATPTNKSYDSTSETNFRTEQVIEYDDMYFVSPNCSTVLYDEALALSAEYDREDLYNSQGELVYKYTKKITIVDEGTIVDSEGTVDTVLQYINAMLSGLTTRFVAFTTSLSEYPNGFTEDQRKHIINSEPQAQLMFKQVSDLSYEQISADNAIKASEITIFKTTAGEHFDDDVLQSIDSAYYGNSELTNIDIINTFTDLIGTTSDEDLQSKFDNLAYVLTVHGKSTDILVRLNEFRKTFVETSTATPVGRFHEKLEIRLYNTNNAVKRGILVRKTLNVSPTVVDARTTATTPYEAPVLHERYDFERANSYIHTKSAKLGAYALPAGYSFSTEEAQLAIESISSTYDRLKETSDELAQECQRAYELIWEAIYEAFDVADDAFEDIIIGARIPQSRPEETARLTRSQYGLYLNTGLRREGGPLPEHYEPVVLKNGGLGSMPIYYEDTGETTGTGGDLDGDGVVASSPQYSPITIKVWPFYESFYADVFNDSGIRLREDSPIRGLNYIEIEPSRILQSTRDITELPEQTNINLYYDIDSASDYALEAEKPNAFYEGMEYIRLADKQSGAMVEIKVEESSRSFKTLGFKKTEYVNKQHTFDADRKIDAAIENFRVAYRSYAIAAADASAMKNAITNYTEIVALGGVAGVELLYTKYNLYLNGFVFFDYEKALHRASNIARVFDVAKVEKLFGNQLSHTYFKVIESKIEKFYDGATTDEVEPGGSIGGGSAEPFEPMPPFSPDDVPDKYDGVGELVFVANDSKYPEVPSSLGNTTSYPHVGDVADTYETYNMYTDRYSNMAIVLPDYLKTTQATGISEDTDYQGALIGNYVEQPSWNMWAGDETDSDRAYTYFIPRSFKFASPDANNDYRLLCYEFQDVVGPYAVGEGADGYGENAADGRQNMGGDFGSDYLFNQNQIGNSYIAAITVKDNTKDMYVMIARTFLQAKDEYEKYYQAIIEECSHNLSDERMNKFFIDGVIANYSSAPHLAPWYRVPLVYLTHMDLLTDMFGGSDEQIKLAAIEMSQRLHPANVTLTEAESFKDMIQSVWETYYQPGTGTATIIMDGFEFNKMIEFGGMGAIDGYVATMNDLPSPVNLDYLGYSFVTGDVVAVDTDDIP